MKTSILFILFLILSFNASAGVDREGVIERVWFNHSDRIWFKINNPSIDEYCKPQWYGFNLYVLKSDKDFPYYYGLITSALSKGSRVRVSNIGIFDGQSACNIVETGYGLLVYGNQ